MAVGGSGRTRAWVRMRGYCDTLDANAAFTNYNESCDLKEKLVFLWNEFISPKYTIITEKGKCTCMY